MMYGHKCYTLHKRLLVGSGKCEDSGVRGQRREERSYDKKLGIR